ncbi:SMI1/KNR4 family protein [Kribbella sp. NPDC023855]|uniref:SMI1/KNR4 family protein n=1 Tax=Kribbella sp. NPDC023855 TaxID=3154698 RepID=UPI0033CC9682
MDRPVADSWEQIVEWLRLHVPAAAENLQPRAPWGQISSLRAGMARRLPGDLVAWLNVCNGFTQRGAFGYILPVFHIPLPVEEMMRRRDRVRAVHSARPREGEGDPAGTASTAWLDAFLPISDSGNDVELFVDLRDGDLFGSVGQFDAEGGGFSYPQWASTAGMLADVADALTLGQPAMVDYARRQSTEWSRAAPWEPYVDDGRLRWRPVVGP